MLHSTFTDFAPDRHLPAGGPFEFRDYGVLGLARHRWPVTAMSAMAPR